MIINDITLQHRSCLLCYRESVLSTSANVYAYIFYWKKNVLIFVTSVVAKEMDGLEHWRSSKPDEKQRNGVVSWQPDGWRKREERERKVRREIVAGLATTILGERYYTLRSPHYTLAGYKCTACSGGVMFSPRPDVPLSIPCQHRPACSAYESITHMHLRRHQMVAGGLVVTANWGHSIRMRQYTRCLLFSGRTILLMYEIIPRDHYFRFPYRRHWLRSVLWSLSAFSLTRIYTGDVLL